MNETVALERIRVPAWAWFLVGLLTFGVYLLSMENGTVLANGAENLHEFFHDARHFIGVPCH